MKQKLTKSQLRLRLKHMEAQLAHAYHFADAYLKKAGTDRMMASGVVLELTANNGEAIIPPVMIKNGLSEATIAAIRADLARSYELAIEFRPSGCQAE